MGLFLFLVNDKINILNLENSSNENKSKFTCMLFGSADATVGTELRPKVRRKSPSCSAVNLKARPKSCARHKTMVRNVLNLISESFHMIMLSFFGPHEPSISNTYLFVLVLRSALLLTA